MRRKKQFGATGLEVATLLAIVAVFTYVVVVVKPDHPGARDEAPRARNDVSEDRLERGVKGGPVARLRQRRGSATATGRDAISISRAPDSGLSTQRQPDAISHAISVSRRFAERVPPER